MSVSVCLDSVVDWITTSEHFDARMARSCRPGNRISGSFTEPASWGGRDVTGLQKAAGCRYNQTTNPTSWIPCDYDPERYNNCVLNQPPPVCNSSCVASYLRRENGTTDVNNGGNVQDC